MAKRKIRESVSAEEDSQNSAHPTDADFRGDLDSEPKLMQREGRNKMPLIDPAGWDLDNIPELKVLPAGSEVRVRINEVITGTDKSGNDYVNVRLGVVDEPLVREFGYFMNIPSHALSENRLVSVKRAWKDVGEAFGFPMNVPFNPESDWPGSEAWAILGIQKDERYGQQNVIQRWLKSTM